MMLQWVTFSGADNTVPRHRLVDLCQRTKVPIEIALLASDHQASSHRYPGISVALGLAQVAKEAGQMVAVHLCGSLARLPLQGWSTGSTQFLPLMKFADRIQVNLPENLLTPETILAIKQRLTDKVGEKPVIFQWRQPTFPAPPPGVQWLFDCSAGNGISPGNWPQLPEGQMVGLAGGLGPGKIAPLIAGIQADTPYWIDMESSLRDKEDRFNVDTCLQVLQEVESASLDAEYRKWACGACGNQPPCPCSQDWIL